MVDEAVLEQRLAILERTVAELQHRLDAATKPIDWLTKITGSISDKEAFLEVLEYGRTLRQADRPADELASKAQQATAGTNTIFFHVA